jgi:hypothetical protein
MRKRVRVICYAWGDKYVDDFLGLTLPALLSDGNVPELARRFDLDFVFLTEEHQFGRVRGARSWQRLETVCATKLVSLDDLIVGYWYGISLTKSLVRGFADLGDAVLDTWLVFLNADFILADGSYRAVADRIEAGERLVFAPSYCVVRETVLPVLNEHLVGEVLSVTPRRMAGIGLPHRHYTVRAKTVNQRLFRIHRYDQFYWYVDETTLLGRQMPIALVAMRPEKVIKDIRTFWDYGIVSEAAPTARHCVLGDSDDYLMLELRDERTFAELIQLGWPTPEEIARDLSSFTTKDQRDHLGYDLVWHSADLPPTMAEARAGLEAFVDDVRQRLAPPVSHLEHRFWTEIVDRFDDLRAQYLARPRTHVPPDAAEGLPTDTAGAVTQSLSALPDAEAIADAAHWPAVADAVHPPAVAEPIRGRLHSEPLLRGRRARFIARFFGSVPFVSRLHPYWADLRHAARALAEAMPLDSARVLLVSPGAGLFERVTLLAAGHRKVSPDSLVRRAAPPTPPTRFAGDLSVTIEGPDGTEQELAATRVSITQRVPAQRTVAVLAPDEMFDLCICELGWDDMRRFREIFAALRSHIRPGGRILVLHVDGRLRERWHQDPTVIRTCFPVEGRSEVLFSGSAGSRFARRLLSRAGGMTGRHRKLAIAAAAALASLGSLISTRAVERQDAYKFGRYTTSLTMVIDLP